MNTERKQYRYRLEHGCDIGCGRRNSGYYHSKNRRLCRTTKNGKLIHISYDRVRNQHTAKSIKTEKWVKVK